MRTIAILILLSASLCFAQGSIDFKPESFSIQSHDEALDGLPVVRRRVEIVNTGAEPGGLEYLSSAMLHGLADPVSYDGGLKIWLAYNSWMAEGQWHSFGPSEWSRRCLGQARMKIDEVVMKDDAYGHGCCAQWPLIDSERILAELIERRCSEDMLLKAFGQNPNARRRLNASCSQSLGVARPRDSCLPGSNQ